MKEIPNKLTQIPHPTVPKAFSSWSDLIRQSLDFPPEGGFTPSVMRARSRVELALDNPKPQSRKSESSAPTGFMIVLEDADFTTAREALAAAKWRVRSHDLLEMFTFFSI